MSIVLKMLGTLERLTVLAAGRRGAGAGARSVDTGAALRAGARLTPKPTPGAQ